MHLIDETRRKSKSPPRNRLAPLQDTQKVLEWSAQHGLAVDNEVLLGIQKGPEATGGNPSPFSSSRLMFTAPTTARSDAFL
eukprot:5435091-Prymnesium_polylepis.1